MEIKVFIAGQERTFAEVLAARLDDEEDIKVAGAAQAGMSSHWLTAGKSADVVVLDSDLAGGTANRLCAEVVNWARWARVIVLSSFSEPERIVNAIRAGAAAWVRKDESLERLLQAIRGVACGESWLPPGELGNVLRLLLREQDRHQRRHPRHAQDGAVNRAGQQPVPPGPAAPRDRGRAPQEIEQEPQRLRTDPLARLGQRSRRRGRREPGQSRGEPAPHAWIPRLGKQAGGKHQADHHPGRQVADPPLHPARLGQRRIHHLEQHQPRQLTEVTRREPAPRRHHGAGNDRLDTQRSSCPSAILVDAVLAGTPLPSQPLDTTPRTLTERPCG